MVVLTVLPFTAFHAKLQKLEANKDVMITTIGVGKHTCPMYLMGTIQSPNMTQ